MAASGGGGNSDLAKQCPIGSIDKLAASEKPVEITYWHSFPRENERLITEITDAFNASQNDVKVKLVNQTSYGDTLTAFRAAYGKADSPDFVLLEDKETQQMIDSQAVIPAQACVDADNYDMSDFLPRVTDYFTVEDTLWPMPFNVSNPVLYYNRAMFTAAGLDPDKPPTTLDEITAASQKIVDAGAAPHGWALKLDPWLLEQWTAMAGKAFVDNGNGRDARATKVTFDNDDGLAVYKWMDDMYKSGLAENTGRPEGNINHYLAVGNKTSAMTADTSAALGTVLSVIGQFPGVELGVARVARSPGRRRDVRRRRRELHREGQRPRQDRSRVALRQVPRRPRDAGEVGADRLHPDPAECGRPARGAAALAVAAVLQGRVRPARHRQHDRRGEGSGDRRLRGRAQGARPTRWRRWSPTGSRPRTR